MGKNYSNILLADECVKSPLIAAEVSASKTASGLMQKIATLSVVVLFVILGTMNQEVMAQPFNRVSDFLAPPNSVKDEWGNVNTNAIFLCSFKTELPKPCITSIVRANSAIEKTNATQVVFDIIFNNPITNINSGNLNIDWGTFSSAYRTNNNPETWRVTINVINNSIYKAGKEVKITGVNSNAEFNYLCAPNNTNEHYNVRHKFMANVEVLMMNQNWVMDTIFKNNVLQYDNFNNPLNRNIKRANGEIRLEFDEKVAEKVENKIAYPLEFGVGQKFNNLSYNSVNGISACKIAPFNAGMYAPYYIIFVEGLLPGPTYRDRVVDDWGNDTSLNDYDNWYFETGQYKITILTENDDFVKSREGGFAISNIKPNPIVNYAEFTIYAYGDGNIDIVIYDLAGSYIMSVLSDNYMRANTEKQIHLTLEMLPAGTYTIMVSLGNDIIAKQIVIIK